MSALSDFTENKLVDHVLRGLAWTAPSALYVALMTSAPSDSGGGTEVSGGSYARVQVGPSASAWKSTNGATSGASTGTGGQSLNGSTITYPSPSGNWGVVTHVAIYDASIGGNLIAWGALALPKTINASDSAPSFGVDSFSITFA